MMNLLETVVEVTLGSGELQVHGDGSWMGKMNNSSKWTAAMHRPTARARAVIGVPELALNPEHMYK